MLAPEDVTPLLSNAFRYSSATDFRWASVMVCFVTTKRLDRNTALILREPLVETLKLRI